MVVQLEDPLELLVKRGEFNSGFWFLSRSDMNIAFGSD